MSSLLYTWQTLGVLEDFAGAQVGDGYGQLSPSIIARWPRRDIEAFWQSWGEWTGGWAGLDEHVDHWLGEVQGRRARTHAYAATITQRDVHRARALSLYADVVVMRDPINWCLVQEMPEDYTRRNRRALAEVCQQYINLRPLLEVGAIALAPWAETSPLSQNFRGLHEACDQVDWRDFSDRPNAALHRDWLRSDLVRGCEWMSRIGGHVCEVTGRRAIAAAVDRTPTLVAYRLDALSRCPPPRVDELDSRQLARLIQDSAALSEVRQVLGDLYDAAEIATNGDQAQLWLEQVAREQLSPALHKLRAEMRPWSARDEAVSGLSGAIVAGVEHAATSEVGAGTAAAATLGALAAALQAAKRVRRARESRRILNLFFELAEE